MNKSAESFVNGDSGQLKAKKMLALADYFLAPRLAHKIRTKIKKTIKSNDYRKP